MLLIRLHWQSGSRLEVELTLTNPFGKPTITLPSSDLLAKIKKDEEKDKDDKEPKEDKPKEDKPPKVDKPIEPIPEPSAGTPEPRQSYTARILAQFGGLESNIPINHPYWQQRKARKTRTT